MIWWGAAMHRILVIPAQNAIVFFSMYRCVIQCNKLGLSTVSQNTVDLDKAL